VEKKDYRILPHLRRQTRHVHMGVAYISLYYVAIANPWLARVRSDSGLPDKVGNGHRAIDTMTEVSDARWMDVLQIRVVDHEKKIENLVAPVFRLAKLFVAGKCLLSQKSSAQAPQLSPSWEKQPQRPIPDQQICAMLDKKLGDSRPSEVASRVNVSSARGRGMQSWASCMPRLPHSEGLRNSELYPGREYKRPEGGAGPHPMGPPLAAPSEGGNTSLFGRIGATLGLRPEHKPPPLGGGAIIGSPAVKAPQPLPPIVRSANSKLVRPTGMLGRARNAWKTVTYTRRNKNAPTAQGLSEL
jgi:hypothetical protein